MNREAWQYNRCPECGTSVVWTRSRIVEAIHLWATRYGYPPILRAWNGKTGLDHPAASTVQDIFGSWNAAIQAAGYRPRRSGGQLIGEEWTHNDIKLAIFRWVFDNGGLPRGSDWITPPEGYPSRRMVRKVFGSWNAAIRASGYSPTVAYANDKRV